MKESSPVPQNRHNHGGDLITFAHEYGHDLSAILDLSVNTWPFGVPDGLLDTVLSTIESIDRYPDIHTTRFRSTVAEHHDVSLDSIVPCSGSIQLIYTLCSSPQYTSVITHEPTFNECRRAANVFGKFHAVNYCLEATRYQIDVEPLKVLLQDNQLVFICNPNNPTGTVASREIIHEILNMIRSTESILIVDEAFIEFSPDISVARLVSDNRNLVVLRSLTKFFGLAGLRVGYALGHPETVRKIAQFIPPWSVNSVAQAAGEWVLHNTDLYKRRRDAWRKETQRLMHALGRIGHYYVFPSRTSYFLFRVPDENHAADLYSGLCRKGIMIRRCNDFFGLDATYFRVGTRTVEENQRFLNEIEQICLG